MKLPEPAPHYVFDDLSLGEWLVVLVVAILAALVMMV